jgi:hypothetical protein
MTDAPIIHVVDDDITALLLAGQQSFTNVRDVTVGFADFTQTTPGGPVTTYGVGQYVAATIRGGQHNGDRIVAPLRAVHAVRVAV